MRRTVRLIRTFSAADATRFTSTPPHAFSKAPPVLRASTLTADPGRPPPSLRLNPATRKSQQQQPQSPSSTPGKPAVPSGGGDGSPAAAGAEPARVEETPAEKVARLRAARAAAKTQIDIIVCVGVTTYALSSMIIYNRRKRRAWYADQIRAQEEDLVAAIENDKRGLPLTEDQTLVLNREKARFAAEEERRNKPTYWGRVVQPMLERWTGFRFGEGEARAAKGEEGEADAESVVQKIEDGVVQGEKRVGEGLREMVRGNLAGGGGVEAEQGVIMGLEEARTRKGGPLDQAAENAVESAREKVGGWFGR
ncbi:MAG: hypothetical protein Q9191_008349 [Dirinaria sp. TL-2023a]